MLNKSVIFIWELTHKKRVDCNSLTMIHILPVTCEDVLFSMLSLNPILQSSAPRLILPALLFFERSRWPLFEISLDTSESQIITLLNILLFTITFIFQLPLHFACQSRRVRFAHLLRLTSPVVAMHRLHKDMMSSSVYFSVF